MMNNKPTLLTYLNGLPDIESIYPILVTLNNRAKINIKVIVYSKLLRKEPRLVEAFQKNNLFPIMGSKFSMKFAFWKDINKADAVLTISDPNFDTITRKQRSYYIKKTHKKSIFVQHGVYQIAVNKEPIPGQSINYYSSKLLLWESMKERVGISDASKNKSSVVGFVKKRLIKPLQYNNYIKLWQTRYRQKLLICHSFRWGREDIKIVIFITSII